MFNHIGMTIILMKSDLSHNIVSGSGITPCFKIDKVLVLYIFVTLCNDGYINVTYILQNLEVCMSKA